EHRPLHHQKAARRRVERDHPSGARNGSARPGPLDGDERFQARVRGICQQAETGVRRQLMPDRSFLSWPFFDPKHRTLGDQLQRWCAKNVREQGGDVDAECRWLVTELGAAGFLKLCVADGERRPDVRSLAIARETLAYHSALADFAFAMQGLGSGAISLFGTIEQKRAWLPRVASGEAIAALAMTEPECGSGAAHNETTAMLAGNEW